MPFQIGAGKFIYCQRFNTRIFDFESSQISKRILVQTNRVDTKKRGREESAAESVEFGDITAFACKKLSALPSELMAIGVRSKFKTGDQMYGLTNTFFDFNLFTNVILL